MAPGEPIMVEESGPGITSRRKVIFIVAGGPLADLLFLHRRILEVNPSEVICADGGARHVLALGMAPQTVIGDMDSLSPVLLDHLLESGCRILRYPGRKDETDTELALRYALERKPDEIEIYGALGGRIDHTLANVSLLVMAAREGIKTRIIDETTELFVVSEGAEIWGTPEDIVSLFPLTTEVKGITLEGFEYPLQKATMEIGKPYGISNRLLSNKGAISISAGYLLVVKSRVEEGPGRGGNET
jgi:thiamine pyrophosphokinase